MDAVFRWLPTAEKYAREYNVPVEIVLTIIKLESDGNSNAIGAAGEIGLGQVLPKEAGPDYANRPEAKALVNPDLNIKWICMILAWNYKQLGSWKEAVLAYNLGLGGLRTLGIASVSAKVYDNAFNFAWQDLWGQQMLPWHNEFLV